jgi:hypothetical protein
MEEVIPSLLLGMLTQVVLLCQGSSLVGTFFWTFSALVFHI